MCLGHAFVVCRAYAGGTAHKSTAVNGLLRQAATLFCTLVARRTEFPTAAVDHIFVYALAARGTFEAGLAIDTATAMGTAGWDIARPRAATATTDARK